MKRSELFFSVLQIPLDFFALLLAFVFSYNIRNTGELASNLPLSSLASRLKYDPNGVVVLTFDHYLRYLSVIIPAMLVIFALSGLYALRSNSSWPKRISNIFIGVSMGEFFILVLFLLKKDFFLPRSTVLYSWLFCTVFVLLERFLVRLLQKQLYAHGIGTVRIGVIGKNKTASQVILHLNNNPYSAYRLVSHLDSPEVNKVIKQIREKDLDELIVVSEQYSNEDLILLRNHCLEEHISFSFVPPLLTALQSNFDIQTIRGVPMIEVRPTPLEGWGRVLKRSFDIVGSLLSLILFSPFFIAIAVLLKIYSPGPLFYKHRRIGKNRQPIDVWKFRSMKWEYCTGSGLPGDQLFKELLAENPKLAKEWEENRKLKDDPRITKIGKILRQTHLDELPQFFTVLTGKLSLVGPRPIVEEEVKRFGEKARILFTVKPGITGPWQVKGGNELDYAERVTMNTYYIEHWNLGLDIKILLQTVLLLLKRGDKHGAY